MHQLAYSRRVACFVADHFGLLDTVKSTPAASPKPYKSTSSPAEKRAPEARSRDVASKYLVEDFGSACHGGFDTERFGYVELTISKLWLLSMQTSCALKAYLTTFRPMETIGNLCSDVRNS